MFAQVHHGQVSLCECPQFFFNPECTRPALDRMEARQHTLYVAVQYGVARVMCKRKYRSRSGTTDAGQLHEQADVARQFAVMALTYNACGTLEVARACVVAQTRPQVQHLVERGGRKRGRIRKALHEAQIIGDDGADLRLLQHDF